MASLAAAEEPPWKLKICCLGAGYVRICEGSAYGGV